MRIEYFQYKSQVGNICIYTVAYSGKENEKNVFCVKINTDMSAFARDIDRRFGLMPIYRENEDILHAFEEYFSGHKNAFINIKRCFLWGTPFHKSVWNNLERIPRGQTRSYSWLASEIGKPKAYRAVGAANGANPIPIIYPCHRVIRSDGSLGGYSGGTNIKLFLLKLEGAYSPF